METTNKHIVVFDIDDTIVRGQSQKLFLTYLKRRKLVGFIYFFRIYFWFLLYKLSLVKNPQEVVEYAIAYLRGKKESEVAQLCKDFVANSLADHIFPKAQAAIDAHRAKGDTIILVSNAIEPLVQAFASFVRVDHYRATPLSLVDDSYTGNLAGPLVYGDQKVTVLKKYLAEMHIREYTLTVYTDHQSDIPLLEFADVPNACNPTKQLLSEAHSRGWNVIHF